MEIVQENVLDDDRSLKIEIIPFQVDDKLIDLFE